MMKSAKNFLDAHPYNIPQHRNYEGDLNGLANLVARSFGDGSHGRFDEIARMD